MPYNQSNMRTSNVNYLNKDFSALKDSLVNYAKSYFPDTYQDFNETSTGMMLLEMNAYVGDVLSFYIDQQYQEMLLPLARERRNVINIARMFGYNVKPVVPAFVDLTFGSNVSAMNEDSSKVDYTNAGVFSQNIEIKSVADEDITFTTLEPVDFTISSSSDTDTIQAIDSDTGLATSYRLERTVRAVSATQKTMTFQVGSPEKFRKITIPDKNVIDIISCIDSNGNEWYEVDYLAQDKIPLETHYTELGRGNAYQNLITGETEEEAVPYSLRYIRSTKRFTRETNQDNTTSLVFGNGILRQGALVDSSFIDMQQVGVVVPGQTNDLNDSINPLLGDEYSTLGEAPNNTTLIVSYRVGGGVTTNVQAGVLTTLPSNTPSSIAGNLSATLTDVVNNQQAIGGKDEENIFEIREQARAFFSTQNRCVTKEDYEARILNMSSKFGNVAKVYVTRNSEGDIGQNQLVVENAQESITQILNLMTTAEGKIQSAITAIEESSFNDDIYQYQFDTTSLEDFSGALDSYITAKEKIDTIQSTLNSAELISYEINAIRVYILGYNHRKQLVGNPLTSGMGSTGLQITNTLPSALMQNIKNYLENFKILTDSVEIYDGYIINFGVFFDVVAEKFANKRVVKVQCIEAIKSYFLVDGMQFNQPIYISQLEFILMGIDGVRSVNHVTIDQTHDWKSSEGTIPTIPDTYSYYWSANQDAGDSGDDSSVWQSKDNLDYGFKYDFESAEKDGIVRPPNPGTPSVFELKNPNQNIIGVVR